MTSEGSTLNGMSILNLLTRLSEHRHGRGAIKNERAGRCGGESAVQCCYTHGLSAVVTVQDHADKMSQHPTDSTDWTPCITNRIGGHEGGREICWVVCLVETRRGELGMDVMKTHCFHV